MCILQKEINTISVVPSEVSGAMEEQGEGFQSPSLGSTERAGRHWPRPERGRDDACREHTSSPLSRFSRLPAGARGSRSQEAPTPALRHSQVTAWGTHQSGEGWVGPWAATMVTSSSGPVGTRWWERWNLPHALDSESNRTKPEPFQGEPESEKDGKQMTHVGMP